MKDQCSDIKKLLERYYDNERSEKEKMEIDVHLTTCTECKRELKSLQGLSVLIREYGTMAAEEETFEKVWHGVKKRTGEPVGAGLALPTNKVWHSVRLLYKPILASAFVVLLMLAWLFYPYKTEELPEAKTGLVVVEAVESSPKGVMVFNANDGSVAVIWLFEIEDGEEEAI